MVGQRMRWRVAAAPPGAQDVPFTADLEATDRSVVLDDLDQYMLPYAAVPVRMGEVRKSKVQFLSQFCGVMEQVRRALRRDRERRKLRLVISEVGFRLHGQLAVAFGYDQAADG